MFVQHTVEPFQRLVNQGLILGPVEHIVYYKDGAPVSSKDVDEAAVGGPVMKTKDKSPVEPRKVAPNLHTHTRTRAHTHTCTHTHTHTQNQHM